MVPSLYSSDAIARPSALWHCYLLSCVNIRRYHRCSTITFLNARVVCCLVSV